MKSFLRSIANIFEGAVRAFEAFPASILCALAFMAVTLIRIQLDWSAQEPYNFLFNCLHFALAFGAVFSLTAITAAQSRFPGKTAFVSANLMGIAAAAAVFLLLYFFGEAPSDPSSRYAVISILAAARVSAAIFVSLLIFIIIAGDSREGSDFSKSLFMVHKAFFLALIYGMVIMAGASGVAGAVEALLYHGMSGKVYMVLGALTGFLAFTIFLGYFPDFRRGAADDHRESAQRQPRYIALLLSYIMIPILLALTVVLFLWSGRTVVTGDWPEFTRLAGIATAYSLFGLWLHIMVTHHESGLAGFYRRVYPFAALVILAFEGGALVSQVGKYGLKITEYNFLLVWIVTAAAVLLLILRKTKAHRVIAALVCAAAVFAVLPLVGYHALPVSSQVHRLEALLLEEGMLENGRLIPAAGEPGLEVREAVTDAVYYVTSIEGAKLPDWLDAEWRKDEVFEAKLGFKPTWPEWNPGTGDPGAYLGTSLYLKSEAVDVRGYDWGVLLKENGASVKSASVTGAKGVYTIDWLSDGSNGVPSLRITLDDRVIAEEDMNGYIDRISKKYPPGKQKGSMEAGLEDMSYVIENESVAVLLVFDNAEINVDPQADHIYYWLNLNTLYIKEKQSAT